MTNWRVHQILKGNEPIVIFSYIQSSVLYIFNLKLYGLKL